MAQNNNNNIINNNINNGNTDNNDNDDDLIRLSEEHVDRLRSGLDELREMEEANDFMERILGQPLNSEDSERTSFDDAFPNFGKDKEVDIDSEKYELLFKKIQEIFKFIETSPVAANLLKEKGLLNYLETFNKDSNNKVLSEEQMAEINKITESLNNKLSNEVAEIGDVEVDKPLGEFGEVTLNQIWSKYNEYCKPLSDVMVGVDPTYVKLGVSSISFVLIYRTVCSIYSKIIHTNPAYKQKLSKRDAFRLDKMRINRVSTFTTYTAPLIVAALFSLKVFAVKPAVDVTLSINTGGGVEANVPVENEVSDISNNKISFFSIALLKKISKNIGLVFLVSFILMIVEKYLKPLPIDWLYYFKWGMVIYIILVLFKILSIVVELMLFKYVCNHKDLKISKKLPLKLQDRLDLFKSISRNEINSLNFEKLYYIDFLVYVLIFFIANIILLVL